MNVVDTLTTFGGIAGIIVGALAVVLAARQTGSAGFQGNLLRRIEQQDLKIAKLETDDEKKEDRLNQQGREIRRAPGAGLVRGGEGPAGRRVPTGRRAGGEDAEGRGAERGQEGLVG